MSPLVLVLAEDQQRLQTQATATVSELTVGLRQVVTRMHKLPPPGFTGNIVMLVEQRLAGTVPLNKQPGKRVVKSHKQSGVKLQRTFSSY